MCQEEGVEVYVYIAIIVYCAPIPSRPSGDISQSGSCMSLQVPTRYNKVSLVPGL
jgi:hypothetical protein